MLQRFKLRLGDGTVLLVDGDGLGTWLVDGKAAVQAGRSRNWIPLRKFLTGQRAAAARQARSEAAAWASLPADAPPARRQDRLPLVPPPHRDETPSPALTPPPREDGLPLVPPPPPRDDGLPLVPPPPPRNAVPPPDLTPPRGDELSLVLPEAPQEASPLLLAPPSATSGPSLFAWAPSSEPVPADPHLIEPEAFLPATARLDEGSPALASPAPHEDDALVRITVGEPRVVQFAAEEPASAGSEAPATTPLEEEPLGVSAGASTALESSRHSPEPLATEPAVPGYAGEPHEIQALAEEFVSSEAGTGPVAYLPVIPFKPLEEDSPTRPSPLLAGPDPSYDGTAAREFWPTDDHSDEARSGDAVPVRPMKPRSAVSVPAKPGNRIESLDVDGPLGDALLQDGRTAAALRFAASFGAFLSRCLDPINRLERGLPPFHVQVAGESGADRRTPKGAPLAPPGPAHEIAEIRPIAEEPSFAAELGAGPSEKSDGHPVIRLKPVDDDEAPLWDPSRGQQLLARARQWVQKPATWAARLVVRDRPGPPAEPEMLRPAEPDPREALQAPLAISELAVLRFATVSEPAVVEDLYGGDESESLFPVAWLWTKRLALGAALLAGAAFAALTFDGWSPRAAEIGETTLSEIDGRVRSHHLAGQRREAVAEVANGLPQLDPETIDLVMTASPIGLLDAAGVFELACDAADRGVSALTASDATELAGLQQGLLDSLLPAERERLREFHLARERRAVFPVDGQQALRAYARGARQLPPPSQERLRLLLGRAINAGLGLPHQAETGDASAR